MTALPVFIPVIFLLTVLLTVYFLSRATHFSPPVMVGLILWLVLQGLVSRTGFYTNTSGFPPRFALVLMPPVIFTVVLFVTAKGRRLVSGMDATTLTLLHVVRIPVEIVLFFLMMHKVVPGIMTFEGRNFDILSGLTAPFVVYFGYLKNRIGRKMLIGWNIACLFLLGNVVTTALLSAPLAFQQFAFDQPNIAIFYFPYVLLPGFVVPAVLFAHLASLRQLISSGKALVAGS